MSDIGRAFERQLADWRTRYAERPTREMVHLCLIALEREANVAVAYDHAILSRRLAAMSLPTSVRELLERALIWVWKTEEMHAVYVRNALRRLGHPLVDARSRLQQTAGAVGGWTVSLRQHRRPDEAPFSQAAATLLIAAGSLSGRVPREVRGHLRYSSFRDFCRYNIDTEGTAWLCWRRLTELAAEVPLLSGGHVDDFRRVADDEERHGRVFTILADALTEDDRLRDVVTEEALASQLEAVGENFLPHALRSRHRARSPIGSGAPVRVLKGREHGRSSDLLRELLRNSTLPRVIEDRARAGDTVAGALRVAVKLCSTARGMHSAAPEMDFGEQLALVLREIGLRKIAMLVDGSATRRADRPVTSACSAYEEFASRTCRRVVCAADQVPHAYSRGLGQYTIARAWRDADVRILCADARPFDIRSMLVSAGELGSPSDALRSPQRQAERATAAMMVLDDFPPHFVILRVSRGVPDPYRGPQHLYASEDALALDRAAASELGGGDWSSERVRRAAEQWFGTPAASDCGIPSTMRRRWANARLLTASSAGLP